MSKQIAYKLVAAGNRPETGRVQTRCPASPGVRWLPVRLTAWLALLAFAPFSFADAPYGSRTNDELTQIAADWETLSQEDRRALLTEVRSRMAALRPPVPMMRIQKQRRYGRVIRQPDGTLLHIERRERSVEYRPMPDAPAGRPFGIGFEHRLGVPTPTDSDRASSATAPAIPVNAPSG